MLCSIIVIVKCCDAFTMLLCMSVKCLKDIDYAEWRDIGADQNCLLGPILALTNTGKGRGHRTRFIICATGGLWDSTGQEGKRGEGEGRSNVDGTSSMVEKKCFCGRKIMWVARWKRSLWDGCLGNVHWRESNEGDVRVGGAFQSLDSQTIFVFILFIVFIIWPFWFF